MSKKGITKGGAKEGKMDDSDSEMSTSSLGEDENEFLESGDFVFYTDKQGNLMSGGFRIDSSLFQQQSSPFSIVRANGGGRDEAEEIITRGNTDDVAKLFENLAVPVGLSKGGSESSHSVSMTMSSSGPLDDDLHDKLFAFIEKDNRRKRQTRHVRKPERRKTIRRSAL